MTNGQGPVIKVVGVGGGGSNAVNRMIEAGILGVEFIAMNTDVQVLDNSRATRKVQLGTNLTRGLGAGGDPEVGRNAAEESKNEVRKILEGSDMVFITAGMGGGTGTGAAPIIAELARELGALSVAVVTRPFSFEGPRRTRLARGGVDSLVDKVDTIITIPNDRLLEVVERKTSLIDAFRVADDILRQGVQGISDIITIPGQINVDFADVRAVMTNAGPALMGIGYGLGEQRAIQAAQSATNSPLLEQTIHGATGLLVNITSSEDLTLAEVNEAMAYIHSLCDENEANIFFGTVIDPAMDGQVRISVLATGFNNRTVQPEIEQVAAPEPTAYAPPQPLSRVPNWPNFGSASGSSTNASSQNSPTATKPAPVPSATAPQRIERAGQAPVWDRLQAATRDASNLYDENDLDIPAFLREHRNKNS